MYNDCHTAFDVMKVYNQYHIITNTAHCQRSVESFRSLMQMSLHPSRES